MKSVQRFLKHRHMVQGLGNSLLLQANLALLMVSPLVFSLLVPIKPISLLPTGMGIRFTMGTGHVQRAALRNVWVKLMYLVATILREFVSSELLARISALPVEWISVLLVLVPKPSFFFSIPSGDHLLRGSY